MKSLTVTEQLIDGPEPIERTLLIDAAAIAVAHVDPKRLEGTLVWPLMYDVNLFDLLLVFASDFLDGSRGFADAIAGFRNANEYAELVFHQDSLTLSAISDIVTYTQEFGETLQLLNLSCCDLTLELVFSERSLAPVRAALALSNIDVNALAHFFTAFHKNNSVREDPRIGETAFALYSPTAIHPSRQGIGFLRPLMLTKKKHDGSNRKEARN